MRETQAAVEGEDEQMELLEEEVAQVLAPADPETAAKYKERVKQELKSKSDMFEDMVEHEEAVRLGEDGWKVRTEV